MEERITIDLKNVTSLKDFHDLMALKLSFPHYYGRNPNAFWDCLTDIVDETIIEISGYSTMEETLRKAIQDYMDLLTEYEKQTAGGFRVMFNCC